MADGFDASAFITAERSQAVARPSYSFSADFEQPKAAENQHCETEEPAALAEIATIAAGAGENLPWADDLRAWASSKCPAFIAPAVWNKITADAVSVSREWGAIAVDAGWSSLDLFGCHRRPQYRRLDFNGLVATFSGLLTPFQITAILPGYAELADRHGAVLRFRRPIKPGSVHLWEGYRMPGGP